MSENTLESAIKRKQITAVSRGKYSFDSFSEKWQGLVLSHLGYTNKAQLIAALKAEQELVEEDMKLASKRDLIDVVMEFYDVRDLNFFKSKFEGSTVTDVGRKCRELSIATAMMRMLDTYKSKKEIQLFTGFNSREELITACGAMNRELDLYGMPTYYNRVREKYYEYAKLVAAKEDPRPMMVPGYLGHKNAEKYGEEHEQIFLQHYLHPTKLNIKSAYKNYSHVVLHEMGLQPMCFENARLLTQRNDIILEANAVRHGMSYYETVTRPFVLRQAPEYSMSLITGDGWVPGTRVKYAYMNPKTKQQEFAIGTMSVWLWYDWKSGAIVSYDVAPNEDSAQIRRSFRHILNLHGVCPLSAMVDKKWMSNPEVTLMFSRLGVQYAHKRGYNPKGNIAERLNKEANKLHRQLDEKWINRTPGVSQDNRNNDDVQKGAKPMDEQEFRAMVKEIVNIHNNELVGKKARIEVLKLHINPACKTPDALQIIEAFANKTIVTARNGIIQFSIASKKYEYEIPDWLGFIHKNIKDNRVKVYYDEKFMEEVSIFRFEDEKDDTNDIFLYSCKPVKRINAAQVEMTEDDWAEFNRQHQKQKDFDAAVKQKGIERQEKLAALNLDAYTVKGVTQEVHKKALQSEGAQLYDTYFEDLEREAGRRVVQVKGERLKVKGEEKKKELVPVNTLSVREKFLKFKDMGFEE